jgi:hypothetical protein
MSNASSLCHAEVVPWWTWTLPIAVVVAIAVAVVRTIVIEWRHNRHAAGHDEQLRLSADRERRGREMRWRTKGLEGKQDGWVVRSDRRQHRPYD